MGTTLAGGTRMAGDGLVKRVIGFVRQARLNGFPVGLAETLVIMSWLRQGDLSRRDELRWGLRAILCGRLADWRRFDELFDAYWFGRGMKAAALVSGAGRAKRARDGSSRGEVQAAPGPAESEASAGAGSDGQGRRGGASTTESLEAIDFRHLQDPEAFERAAELAERLAARMQNRLTRRYRASRRGRRIDFRRTIRDSVATGGTPFRIVRRRRRLKPLRLVVLLDVSGSMNPYSTFFVRFIRGIIGRFRDADAFVFHTRLVHIGEALRERDAAHAIDRLSLISAGWAGGTRIGDSLIEFERHHGARLLSRRTVLIVVSDGYDTGAPAVLATVLAAMRRRVRRLIWLNPMLGWDGYAPVAAGMAAALPHVDLFAPAHNLASLAALEPHFARM